MIVNLIVRNDTPLIGDAMMYHDFKLFDVFTNYRHVIRALVKKRDSQWCHTSGSITYEGKIQDGVLTITRTETFSNPKYQELHCSTHHYISDGKTATLRVMARGSNPSEAFTLTEGGSGEIEISDAHLHQSIVTMSVLGWDFHTIKGKCLDGKPTIVHMVISNTTHRLAALVDAFPPGLKDSETLKAYLRVGDEEQTVIIRRNGEIHPAKTVTIDALQDGDIAVEKHSVFSRDCGFTTTGNLHVRTWKDAIMNCEWVVVLPNMAHQIQQMAAPGSPLYRNFLMGKLINTLQDGPIRVIVSSDDDRTVKYYRKDRDITDFYTTQFGDRVDLTEDELFILNMA